MGIPRLTIPPKLIRLAMRFVDVDAASLPPAPRMAEYGYVVARIARLTQRRPPGRVLDVGCTARMNPIPALFVSLGWEVYGIDLRPFRFEHPRFQLLLGDVRDSGFASGFFDCITAVSTVEHIGLAGRYGVREQDVDGDRKAMEEMARILRDDGTLILTVPYGDRHHAKEALERVYDKHSLAALVTGWSIEDQAYAIRASHGSLEITWKEEDTHARLEREVMLELSKARVAPSHGT